MICLQYVVEFEVICLQYVVESARCFLQSVFMSSVFIITISPPSSLRVTTISSLSRNNLSTWRFAWEMLYLGFCHIPVVLIVRSMCLRKPLMESSAGSMSRGAAFLFIKLNARQSDLTVSKVPPNSGHRKQCPEIQRENSKKCVDCH